MFQIFPALLVFGSGVGIGVYINSGTLKESVSEDATTTVKQFTQIKKQQIAFVIGLICVIIVIGSFLVFYWGDSPGEHDGIANLVMSSASYITTSFALITALLFLNL